MYRRNIKSKVLQALKDTPVVYINGARQTGKSTLAKEIIAELHGSAYLTLDDASTLASAASDPAGFIRNLSGTTIIDEVQKAPGLFPAIKMAVDNNRKPGRFILTGSANILLLPDISESLAGRMEIITMYPLSQGETADVRETFISRIFSDSPSPFTEPGPDNLLPAAERILRGCFPEALERTEEDRKHAWYGSYLSTILQRDIRDLARIEGLTDFPRLLRLMAARTGSLLNMSDLSRGLGIPHTTLRRYIAFLETAFLINRVPAWSPNTVKQLVKAPKIYLCDSGLAAHLCGASAERFAREPLLRGQLFENFVCMELFKQISWADAWGLSLHHFRTADGREVDFILSDPAGRIAAVEVKSGSAAGPEDFSTLRRLAATLGEKLVRGVVLYAGDRALPFGERMMAVPVQHLWQ